MKLPELRAYLTQRGNGWVVETDVMPELTEAQAAEVIRLVAVGQAYEAQHPKAEPQAEAGKSGWLTALASVTIDEERISKLYAVNDRVNYRSGFIEALQKVEAALKCKPSEADKGDA